MTALFVYGTLQPGHGLWHVMEIFADGDPVPDAVEGELFDTGYGFPAAVVGEGRGKIPGHTVNLREDMELSALAHLDRIEGCPDLFHRVSCTTCRGQRVWVYNWSDLLGMRNFTPIPAWSAKVYT